MVNTVYRDMIVRETTKSRMWGSGSGMKRGYKQQLGEEQLVGGTSWRICAYHCYRRMHSFTR